MVGTGRYFGGLFNGVATWDGDRITSQLTTMVFYGVGAAMWGLVTLRLREAEGEVAMRRARDEVAATLHDGVLQTLALVERRTHESDPELAALARTSDRELRAWLFHGFDQRQTKGDRQDPLEALLRQAASRISVAYDIPVTVSVVDDRTARHIDTLGDVALAGAAGEAMTNAAKHAIATKIVVYAESDDDGGVFVSVRDDGRGFDVHEPTSGQGLANSIRRRMADIGGRAAPGHAVR